MKSPTPLLFTLVAAFARRCGPLGGWRRIASAENGDAVLRRFVRYLAKMHPEVTTIDSVTPEIWQAWRGMLDAGSRYPSQVATSRGLLRDADGLRPDTRLALMERLPRPPRRKTVSYSRGEFARIWKAARRVFRVARRRIAANAELLQRYRDGNEPEDCLRFRLDGEEWTPGRILDHLSRTGRMPPSYKRLTREQGRALRDALGISANSRRSRHALFPAPHEIYAVMILLTCERAFNVSTLANLRVSEADIKAARESRRGPVRTETDKPRRGPRRYSGLTLVGREATLWGRAVNLTQHARDTSAQLGNKVDRLLVGCVRGGRAAGPDGVFITNFGKPLSAVGAWHNATTVAGDNGKTLRVSLERLRLSEQVINGVSRQNTPSVSESTYRLPDPRTVDLARPVMLQGQWSALDHAGQRVAKLMTKDQLAEALADPRHFALMFNISEERAVEVLEELPEGGVDTPTCATLWPPGLILAPPPTDPVTTLG